VSRAILLMEQRGVPMFNMDSYGNIASANFTQQGLVNFIQAEVGSNSYVAAIYGI